MTKRLIIGMSLLLFSIMLGSQLALSAYKETIPLQVSITNNPPQVHTVTCNPNPLTLNASGLFDSTILVCSAEIYDPNGYQDISQQGDVNASLMLNLTETLQTCKSDGLVGKDNSSCYHNVSCTYSNENGNTLDVECSFTVWWYAEATSDEGNFTAWIIARDASGNKDYNFTNVTVNDLLAMNITDSVNWGTMQVGQISEETVEVNNTGNVRFDLQINATNMTCTGPGSLNITPQQIAYNNSADTGGAGSGKCDTEQEWLDCCKMDFNPASTCGGFATNFDFSEDATGLGGGPNNTETYLTLKVPSGVSGTCTGWATYTAVKG